MSKKCNKCLRGSITGNGRVRCTAYSEIPKGPCSSVCTNPYIYKKEIEEMIKYNEKHNNVRFITTLKRELKILKAMIHKDINKVYKEEQQRGSGGGGSKNGGSHKNTKQLMKDNRPQEFKMCSVERKIINDTLQAWEEKNGKLDKHKSIGYGMSRSNVDNYTAREMDSKGNPILTPEEVKEAADSLLKDSMITLEEYDNIINKIPIDSIK